MEELLVRLRAQHPAIRADAARELGRRRVAIAVSLLVERLEDRALEVRLAAVEGLGACGGSEAAQSLARVLRGPDPELRLPAARALGRLPAGIAIPPLVTALSTEDPALRQEVTRHLARHGLDCLQPLWAKLRDEGAAGAAAVAAVLGAMAPAAMGQTVAAMLGFAGQEAALEPRLVALLRPLGEAAVEPALGYVLSVDSDAASALAARVVGALGAGIVPRLDAAFVREVQANARGRTRGGRPPASPPDKKHGQTVLPRGLHRLARVYLALDAPGVLALVDLHARSEAPVQQAILPVLSRFARPAWEGALTRVQTGMPPARRRLVLQRLAQIDDLGLPAARIAIFLLDPDRDTALAALTALRRGRHEPASLHAPVLAACRHWVARLPDSLPIVRDLLPLLGSTGPRAVPLLLELRRSPHVGVRVAALEGLGRAGSAEARRELANALGATDVAEVTEAVKGLAALKAVEELLGAASHRQPGVRLVALRALRELKDPRVAPRLLKALGDPDPGCRLAALHAGRFSGVPAALPALLRLLLDPSVPVVQAAAGALGESGNAAATAGLIRTLGRKEAAVRVAAAEALGKLRDRTAEAALMRLLKDPDEAVKNAAALALHAITGKLPPGFSALVIGVPECDAMMRIYQCVINLSPPATRAAMQSAIQQSLQGFRQAARSGPAAAAALSAGCKQAREAMVQSYRSLPMYRSCVP
jgi:HEAT repeat protein